MGDVVFTAHAPFEIILCCLLIQHALIRHRHTKLKQIDVPVAVFKGYYRLEGQESVE